MEDFLSSLISSGPVGIVSAAVVYLIIALQRSKTGKKRDESEVLLNYRVDQLEKSHGDLASNIKELQEAIIQLQISINRFIGKIEK
jgi:chaperonin cofactor prefoldin